MPQEATGTEQPSARTEARQKSKQEAHRLQAMLAVAAVTIGVAALILGWIPETHFPGAVLGVIGLPLALYSQMISATTNERWLNVIGMIASFVGTGFALSNGGFSI